jgi:hypothetical protein
MGFRSSACVDVVIFHLRPNTAQLLQYCTTQLYTSVCRSLAVIYISHSQGEVEQQDMLKQMFAT